MGDGTKNSKKRRHVPETAAVQVGAATLHKRQRSTAQNKQKKANSPGQFDDASTEEEEESMLQNEEEQGDEAAPAATAAEGAKPSLVATQDGQFDDASEPDVSEIPVYWDNNSFTSKETSRAREILPTVPRAPRPQQVPLQVHVPPPPHHVAAAAHPSLPTFPLNTARSNNFNTTVYAAIAPRPHDGFQGGPLQDHPHPLLVPDSNIDLSLRPRILDRFPSDLEERRLPIYRPLATDILMGRGGGANNHEGNLWFRDLVLAYRPEYHRLEKYNKMQLAINLVNYVRHCGTRFLQKIRYDTKPPVYIWFEVGDLRAREKCSQLLREPQRATPPPPETAAAVDTQGKPAAKKSKSAKARSNSTQRRPSASSTIASSTSDTQNATANQPATARDAAANQQIETQQPGPASPRRLSTSSTIETNTDSVENNNILTI